MNDFLKNLRKKSTEFRRSSESEFNKAKKESFSLYQEALKKSEDINQKIRMEKIYMESKYGDKLKNQNFNTVHSKWLQFRDKHLTTQASSFLNNLKGVSESTQKIIKDADLQSKVNQVQQKLSEKGIDSSKLNDVSSKGFSFLKQQAKNLQKAFNENNLSKYFYSPINYVGSYIMKNKSKALRYGLLVVFCYGLGSYIPVAVKDYYLQKQLLKYQHEQASLYQAQLQLEQKRIQYQQNRASNQYQQQQQQNQ